MVDLAEASNEMNNKFIESFLFATIGAKGNYPEAKAKNIAITSSIGSLIPNSPITSLLIAKEMKTNVEENENLQTEVNNRISPKQVAVRLNKILEVYLAKTESGKHDEVKFMGATILRCVFSDSHLKLLRKQSPKAIQDIIDVSLTIPDNPPFPPQAPPPPPPGSSPEVEPSNVKSKKS